MTTLVSPRSALRQNFAPPMLAALVCIDFDGTLAVRDVAPWDLAHAFGDAARHARLEAWLRELVALGATIAIVSRNTRGVIGQCLEQAGWTALFADRVYAREDVERHSAWHGRKSPLLRKALIEPNRLRAEDVLLIDREAVLEVKGPGAARSGEVPPTKVWLTIKKARS